MDTDYKFFKSNMPITESLISAAKMASLGKN